MIKESLITVPCSDLMASEAGGKCDCAVARRRTGVDTCRLDDNSHYFSDARQHHRHLHAAPGRSRGIHLPGSKLDAPISQPKLKPALFRGKEEAVC